MASDDSPYRVLHVDGNNKVDLRYRQDPPMHECVKQGADIAQAMMKTDGFRSAVATLAKYYCEHMKNAWFLQGQTDENQSTQHAHRFLRKILEGPFPLLLLVDRLKTTSIIGLNWRQAWSFREDFDLPRQYIGLNAKVSQMLRSRCSLAS